MTPQPETIEIIVLVEMELGNMQKAHERELR